MTLRQLSEIAGLSEAQLSRIERFGTTKLTVAMRLAEITGHPATSFKAEGVAP